MVQCLIVLIYYSPKDLILMKQGNESRYIIIKNMKTDPKK
jgi:hypothetical protein